MKINIIHLARRFDRLVHLKHELNAQKIADVQFWKGIEIADNPSRGISLAHQQIVFDAKQKKLESVVIVEDDVKFLGLGAFDYFIKETPHNYDLYLGGIMYGAINDENIVKDFAGLTLYRVHSKFYNIFLEASEDGDIDRNLMNKGRFVVCNPMIVSQYEGLSDNSKVYRNYDYLLKNRKLWNG